MRKRRSIMVIVIVAAGLAAVGHFVRRGGPTYIEGHSRHVIATAFSPDGKLFAAYGTTGDINPPPELKWWSTNDWKLLHTIPFSKYGPRFDVIGFTADSKRIVAGNDVGVFTWDTATGQNTGEFIKDLSFEAIAHSSSSHLLAIGLERGAGYNRGVTQVWDVDSKRLLHTIVNGPNDDLIEGAVSPDNSLLVLCNCDKAFHVKARIWHLPTGAPRKTIIGPMAATTTAVAFSPDNQLLALSGAGMVHIYDARTGKLSTVIQNPDTDYVGALAFSPDGSVLGVGRNAMESTPMERLGLNYHYVGGVALWDVKRKVWRQRLNGDNAGVQHLDFSPDGSQLVVNGKMYWRVSPDG